MRKHLVIATRGSRLALWQAEHIKSRLEALAPDLTVSLNVIKTRGDIILDVPPVSYTHLTLPTTSRVFC